MNDKNQVMLLSVENTKMWSWGIVLNLLEKNLPGYDFTRMVRDQIVCPNAKCRHTLTRQVDLGLCEHFDLTLLQNCDSVRLMPYAGNCVARIGGLDMSNPDTDRYGEDLKRVGAIIATNDQLGDIAKKFNPLVEVVPNGVELDVFRPYDPCPNFDRKRFIIGFAGNIWGGGSEYKGWVYYVQAHAYVAADVDQIHLLHGSNQIPHEEMPGKFYAQIDALILPSRGEGCSNVVSEALACGIPVLTTKVGFHGENLTDEENCLFIERDADMIAETIRRLMSDRELRIRLSKNGRKFAEEHHDVRIVAAIYDKVFKKVIENVSAKG